MSTKKIRIFVGRYPSGNKKYENEMGHLWSGTICAECNKVRVKGAMQKFRNKGTNEEPTT